MNSIFYSYEATTEDLDPSSDDVYCMNFFALKL
jgi:hypothetical protein